MQSKKKLRHQPKRMETRWCGETKCDMKNCDLKAFWRAKMNGSCYCTKHKKDKGAITKLPQNPKVAYVQKPLKVGNSKHHSENREIKGNSEYSWIEEMRRYHKQRIDNPDYEGIPFALKVKEKN